MTSGERSHEPRRRWRDGTTPVIGLTGGVASGKTAVAALLAEHGCTAIDADSVGHEILDLPVVQQKLVHRFGPSVVQGKGGGTSGTPRVDRRALAAIVFADQEARRALEAIVHPLMRARFSEAIERALETGHRPVVLDAAILLEAGWQDLCDLVVFVDSPRSQRIRRAAEHRGWSEAAFDSRERAQWPCQEKRRHAEYVIRNDAGVDSLRREVEALVRALGLKAAGPGPSLDQKGKPAMRLQAPPDAGPKAFVRSTRAEPARATSQANRAKSSRPFVRNRQDGPGTDAWQGLCFAM
jgi:dephospho-CoA kinase